MDPNQFLKENFTDGPVDESKKVGHVHLSVGSIAAAEEFYVKILGFEKTLNWGGAALFVSAGGYHHHMAMNTWRSKGAGKRQLTLGLGKVEIVLDNQDQVMETRDRLSFYQIESNLDNNSAQVSDPWGNQILIKST